MKTAEMIDGCENCKHNIPGLEEGLYCINNCINGSHFEPMANVKHPRQHSTPSSTVYLGNDKTKWKSIEPKDPTCNKCTEFDFAHQIPEVNACPIHQPNKYKEQIENRRYWRSLINNFKPTPSSTEPASSPKDWVEDFEHENGNYMNTCCRCKEPFFGHKRRVICKACYTAAETIPSSTVDGTHAMIKMACDTSSTVDLEREAEKLYPYIPNKSTYNYFVDKQRKAYIKGRQTSQKGLEDLIEWMERQMASAQNKYSKGALRISIRKATELLTKK